MTKEKVAVFWIKDGVILNAMPAKSVAFALSVRKIAPKEKLEELVNFYFDASGFSTDEKVKLLNSRKGYDVIGADQFKKFNEIFAGYKSKSKPKYNPGIPELLGELKRDYRDVLNFVTSIADQKALDEWLKNTGGDLKIDEALGTRSEDFKKGRAHFAYVGEKYNVTKTYLVADAPSEIKMGAALSREFGIKPIGYANVTTPEMIVSAVKSMEPEEKIEPSGLHLPSYERISSEMRAAGADAIVRDASGLKEYFRKELAE